MAIPEPLEKDIQSLIIQVLTLAGHRAIRVNSGAVQAGTGSARRFIKFNDTPGCSDLIVCVRPHGFFVVLEVKRPSDLRAARRLLARDPSQDGTGKDIAHLRAQESFIKMITAAGGDGDFVSSPEEALAVIERAVRRRQQQLVQGEQK